MLEYKGYHAKIEFDAEDKILVGKVFGLNDSLNFEGSTPEEIENMFHQSIDNYLALCAEIGKEPEREFKGTFNVRVTPELHREAALLAMAKGETLNQVIADSIEKFVREEATTYKIK